MVNLHFLEKVQIVPAIIPVNLCAGANSGDWVSMRDYGRCAVVFIAGVGGSGEAPVVTLLQGKTSSGGSSKDLDFTRFDHKIATALTGVGTFTTVTQSAGNDATVSGSGNAQKLIVIDIKAEDLDVANDFDWIQASIADPGTTSQLGTVLYFLHEPRQLSKTLPTAIA